MVSVWILAGVRLRAEEQLGEQRSILEREIYDQMICEGAYLAPWASRGEAKRRLTRSGPRRLSSAMDATPRRPRSRWSSEWRMSKQRSTPRLPPAPRPYRKGLPMPTPSAPAMRANAASFSERERERSFCETTYTELDQTGVKKTRDVYV